MKFKAKKEASGTWFVRTNKRDGSWYGERFETELQAKEWAMIQNHHHYQSLMDKAWEELGKLHNNDKYACDIKLTGNDHTITQSDLMC